jgi:hypothetical protein
MIFDLKFLLHKCAFLSSTLCPLSPNPATPAMAHRLGAMKMMQALSLLLNAVWFLNFLRRTLASRRTRPGFSMEQDDHPNVAAFSQASPLE